MVLYDETSGLQDDVSPSTLSIILTTSATPSIPSTELVSSVLSSLPTSLGNCPLYITFDGFALSQRPHGRLKKGQIPKLLAEAYPLYINNVKALFGPCSEELLDKQMCTHISRSLSTRKVMFIRQEYRQGFAFNVKAALLQISTPYVLVLQHDWVFTSPPPPFHQLLQLMAAEQMRIRYITFVARQSIKYETSRGGVLPFYPAIFTAARILMSTSPVLQNDMIACLHFFDRPHLCATTLYEEIFASGTIKRGDFLEDTYGCAFIKQLNAAPTQQEIIEIWQSVGTWMYYPQEGTVVGVRHTSGRTCLAKEAQEERIRHYIVNGRARHTVDLIE